MALRLFHLLMVTATVILVPALAMGARKGSGNALGGIDLSKAEGVANNPLQMMTAMSVLSLLPFAVIMVTSFVKIAVVLSMIRQALGTQQIPPTQILTGMAIILTVYIMHPVALQMKRLADEEANAANVDLWSNSSTALMGKVAVKIREPLVVFLRKHSHPRDRLMFVTQVNRLRGDDDTAKKATDQDLLIVIPAFVLSELTEAFQIGFLIFLPFLALDMTVSNILMALGMQMLNPTTISLPFKLLLFVLVDGWYLLTKGLVLGYQ